MPVKRKQIVYKPDRNGVKKEQYKFIEDDEKADDDDSDDDDDDYKEYEYDDDDDSDDDDSNDDDDDDDESDDDDIILKHKRNIYYEFDKLFDCHFVNTNDKNSIIDEDTILRAFSEGMYIDKYKKILIYEYLLDNGIKYTNINGGSFTNVKRRDYRLL